jgi:hypothetical protein
MKLRFSKVEGEMQVKLVHNDVVSDFSYPSLINHLYIARELEDSEFSGNDITQEEKRGILNMISQIKNAVLNPQTSAEVAELQDDPLVIAEDEVEIPF